MQTEHLVRTLIVGIAWLGVLTTYLALVLTGDAGGFAARLEGMLAVLTPAMLDTLRVARRDRRERQSFGGIAGSLEGVSRRSPGPPPRP